MKTRSNYLDILKGYAIILVVFGHCIQYGSGQQAMSNGVYFDNKVFQMIYSFHMPLLMLISGYLFYNTTKKYSDCEIIKKKVKSLLIPVLAWTTIVTIIDLILFYATKGNLGTAITLKEYARKVLFELWFIWSVFWGCIGTIAFRRIKNRILRAAVICIAVMGLFVFPDKWNLYLYKYTFPFFFIGYLWNKYNISNEIQRCYKAMESHSSILVGGGILIIGYILLLKFYNRDSFIYLTKVSILEKTEYEAWYQIKIDLYRWLIGMIGCTVAVVLCAVIKKIPTKWIAYIGRKSLGIYIISGYFNTRILLNCTAGAAPNYCLNVVETILMLFVCLIIIWGIEKNEKLNMILLGSR